MSDDDTVKWPMVWPALSIITVLIGAVWSVSTVSGELKSDIQIVGSKANNTKTKVDNHRELINSNSQAISAIKSDIRVQKLHTKKTLDDVKQIKKNQKDSGKILQEILFNQRVDIIIRESNEKKLLEKKSYNPNDIEDNR
ncbi:MAG: hypothetical protein KAG66_03060 [Methylococcales bacterium]|nr:hypothetical protein [Methylococcales bacterium]